MVEFKTKVVKEVLDGSIIIHVQDIIPEGRVPFMTDEDIDKAKRNRNYQPQYSDTRGETEESKKRNRRGISVKKGSDKVE